MALTTFGGGNSGSGWVAPWSYKPTKQTSPTGPTKTTYYYSPAAASSKRTNVVYDRPGYSDVGAAWKVPVTPAPKPVARPTTVQRGISAARTIANAMPAMTRAALNTGINLVEKIAPETIATPEFSATYTPPPAPAAIVPPIAPTWQRTADIINKALTPVFNEVRQPLTPQRAANLGAAFVNTVTPRLPLPVRQVVEMGQPMWAPLWNLAEESGLIDEIPESIADRVTAGVQQMQPTMQQMADAGYQFANQVTPYLPMPLRQLAQVGQSAMGVPLWQLAEQAGLVNAPQSIYYPPAQTQTQTNNPNFMGPVAPPAGWTPPPAPAVQGMTVAEALAARGPLPERSGTAPTFGDPNAVQQGGVQANMPGGANVRPGSAYQRSSYTRGGSRYYDNGDEDNGYTKSGYSSSYYKPYYKTYYPKTYYPRTYYRSSYSSGGSGSAATSTDFTGLPPTYVATFANAFNLPIEQYYTAERGGATQATRDYQNIMNLWQSRTGKPMTPEELVRLLTAFDAYTVSLGRNPGWEDFVNYMTMMTERQIEPLDQSISYLGMGNI